VRAHGRWYVLGLLSQQERKNSWWLAEFAGDVSPDGMQRLLAGIGGKVAFATKPVPVLVGPPGHPR